MTIQELKMKYKELYRQFDIECQMYRLFSDPESDMANLAWNLMHFCAARFEDINYAQRNGLAWLVESCDMRITGARYILALQEEPDSYTLFCKISIAMLRLTRRIASKEMREQDGAKDENI